MNMEVNAKDSMRAVGYSRRLSDAINIEAPPTITVSPVRKGIVEFARFTSFSDEHRITCPPLDDSYSISLALIDNPAREIFLGGKHFLKPEKKAGEFAIADLSIDTTIDMKMTFDNIHMRFTKSAFKTICDELEANDIGSVNLQLKDSVDDIVVKSLGHCLLPAFMRPEQASMLFLDHVAIALLTHMATTYAGAVAPSCKLGGLSPRQLRQAKDILGSSLDGEVTLEELARECGLSRSHFCRAFKKATGVPPHRWLMQQRLERAREMLLNSKRSLADIAGACGFADQSHFTRCFLATTGIVPSQWRRMRCE